MPFPSKHAPMLEKTFLFLSSCAKLTLLVNHIIRFIEHLRRSNMFDLTGRVVVVSGASSGRCDAQSNTEWSRNVSNAVGVEKTS